MTTQVSSICALLGYKFLRRHLLSLGENADSQGGTGLCTMGNRNDALGFNCDYCVFEAKGHTLTGLALFLFMLSLSVIITSELPQTTFSPLFWGR